MIVSRLMFRMIYSGGVRLKDMLQAMMCSPKRLAWCCMATGLLLSNLMLASCSGLFGGSSTPTATPTPSHLALTQLHWCGKPSMVFRDEGAVTPTPPPTATSTATATTSPIPGATATTSVGNTPTATTSPGPTGPRTISDWPEVEANLGFTVYLPPMLPRNACLVNAQATIHDPIIGGSFTIGYLLPDHSAFTLSEAPFISQNTAFQCNTSNGATPQATGTPKAGTPAPSPSPTQATTLLCSGAKDTTNVVLSARGSTGDLQQLFNGLQPHINWIPAS
jgi:hypothetical protein